jgi:hypothetical protein
LVVAVPAAADTSQTQSKTVTATGVGQARVHVKNRNSSAAIAAGVAAARKRAITGALNQAHKYALQYASGSGMTLGGTLSVSDQQSQFFGPGPGFFAGPFGPGRYCGRLGRTHRCVVPRFSFVSLTVTYSAS